MNKKQKQLNIFHGRNIWHFLVYF